MSYLRTYSVRKVFLFSFLVVMIILSIVIPTIIVRRKHKPILIQSDGDFLKYNFLGSGTTEDPFIIENYEIKTDDFYAIAIGNVSKSFIIRNNHLQASRDGIFIAISSPDLLIITNNTFDGRENGIGVKIWDTSGCQIINNTFRNCGAGIGIMSLTSYTTWIECTIVNNTFINISQDAIFLFKINKAVIENNRCMYDEGFEEGDYWKRGFYFARTGNITIKNNNLSNIGITILNYELETYLSHIVESNVINGKEFGYFTNIKNETYYLTDYGQLYFVNCSFISVENSFLENCSLGINFAFCSNCSASWNSFTNDDYSGITVIGSKRIDLIWNFFDSNNYGLYIINSLEVDIFANTFKNNRYGCYIDNSTYNLADNDFLNNEVDTKIRD
ncbi:MAG: hypothetical protein HGN29_15780 [Asgard group archaeon]|nr:hypothetical protein [Asgard group archaeon]